MRCPRAPWIIGLMIFTARKTIELPKDRGCFMAFVPDEAQAIQFEVPEHHGRCRLWCPETDLTPNVDRTDGRERIYYAVNRFVLEVAIPVGDDPPLEQKTVTDLTRRTPSPATEAFGRRLHEVISTCHNGLLDYLRNVAKNYWLEPLPELHSNQENYANYLMGCHWSVDGSNWQGPPLVLRQENWISEFVNYYHAEGMTPEGWARLRSFMEKGKPSTYHQFALANAALALSKEDGRGAVVEAAIALESAVFRYVSAAVLALPGAPVSLDQRALDKHIEKAGLTSTVTVLLGALGGGLGIDPNDHENVRRIIEVRNNVIHHGKRTVDLGEAIQLVRSTQRVVDALSEGARRTKAPADVKPTPPG